MKDRSKITHATHELNYVLKKYGKRQTKTNRSLLKKFLNDFRENPDFLPHNRRNFSRYVSATQCFADMQDRHKTNGSDQAVALEVL